MRTTPIAQTNINTSIEIKASDVMFEFSNPLRVEIMLRLAEAPGRLTEVAKTVHVTTAEVSRHLDRLMRVGLIDKNVENRYMLNQYGRILLYVYRGWSIIVENEEFYKTHNFETIPPSFRNMALWNNAEIRSGVFNNLEIASEMSKNAKTFMYAIADAAYPPLFKIDRTIAKNGIIVKKLYQKGVDIPKEHFDDPLFDIRTLENIPFGMKVTENEGGITFFKGGKLDYHEGLYGTDETFRDYLQSMFEYFWERAKPLK